MRVMEKWNQEFSFRDVRFELPDVSRRKDDETVEYMSLQFKEGGRGSYKLEDS